MNHEQADTGTFPFGQSVVWHPNPQWAAASNLQRFMNHHHIGSYTELLHRSVEDIDWFWDAVMVDLEIEFSRPYTRVVDTKDGPEFPHWCVDGEMNIIHNCLDKWQSSPVRDRVALRWEQEEGVSGALTYAELHREVCRCTNALRSLGLGKGDAVGLYMPMIPELAIAFLAIIKVGGVILPLFSGYGHSAIAERLTDAGAVAVITADGTVRRGRAVPMKHILDQALETVPSVCHVLVANRIGSSSTPMHDGRDQWWGDLVARQAPQADTEGTSAEDVLMLIYTSGTTGRPKGAVHTHCGFPIKAAQDLRHAMDLKREDTLYWMTDMGWMMGPWQVFGALLNGATMVFYDGAPNYPGVDRVWSLVENHQVTHLGVSPSLIRVLKSGGIEPVEKHDISSLRVVGSTGSPWDPESWLWLFEKVLQSEKPIINYSGGTEISGGILSGNLLTPLKPCAFSGPVVGMDVDVVDENGVPVRNVVGELVVRRPWIGMTRGFWRDRQRYLDTYWGRFPGLWVHGDFAAVDEDGLWYILGRSDDTLMVAGKRLGSAEFEAVLNAHPLVTESAVIGVPHPIKDEEVVAFCVLEDDANVSEALRTELLTLVARELGKPLKPREVRFAKALPKTRNAKVMHRLIRAAYLDQPLGDLGSLEDPGTVDSVRAAK